MTTTTIADVEVEVPDDVEVHQRDEGPALRVTLLHGRAYSTTRIDAAYMRAHPDFARVQVTRMVADMLRALGHGGE